MSRVRLATVHHMRALLATAAATGMATACGKETKPPEPKVDVAPPASASASASVSAAASAEPPPSAFTGYAVVDPVPRPAHCPDVARLIVASGKIQDEGGDSIIVLTLRSPVGRPDFRWSKDGLTAYGAKVLRSKIVDNTVEVFARIAPDGDPLRGEGASISVKAFCKQGPTTILADVAWVKPLKMPATPSIKVNQY